MVTAWEFFEHPLPEEVPGVIENMIKHMNKGSVFIGTINACVDDDSAHHRCARPVEWWNEQFTSRGFAVGTYPFRSTPRTNLEYLQKLTHIISNGIEEQTQRRFVDEEASPYNPNQHVVCYIYEGTDEE